MGDKRDHARSVRRRGEASAQDLPGIDDPGVDRFDDDRGASTASWLRSGVWVASILALLMLYLVAFPAGIIYLERKGFFNHMPPALETAIEVFASPIRWLYENVPAYESFIDWLDSRF